MLLPFEGIKRPPERDVPEGLDEPPATLVAELKRLMGKRSLLDRPSIDVDGAPPVSNKDRQKIHWGMEEAKEAYFSFSKEVDQWQEKDKRKFELGMRAIEQAERCSTIVAAGCFSPTVDVPDIGWGLRLARVSNVAAEGGTKKYMRDYYEFHKFCQRVEEFIRGKDGFAPDWELNRAFRSNMKHGFELERALNHLKREGVIEQGSRSKSRGPAAEGWRIINDQEG